MNSTSAERQRARAAMRVSMAREMAKAGVVDVDESTGEPTPAASMRANMRAQLAALGKGEA